tara:strand:+ start:601 stop:1017 length:417 start_codon:yes stop_codon:yes gene_type:complete
MATRRTQIVEALKDDLGTIDDVLEANVFRQFKYLEEINDFPSICFLSRGENRLHRGAGRRLAGLQIDIRGYVYDEDEIGEAESLGDSIETIVDAFANRYPQHAVEDARVLSFRTDEGLFNPYGTVDLSVQLTYDVENV